MRFKIDENLPVEVAELLNRAGHDAQTVFDEKLAGSSDYQLSQVCLAEQRAMITLDLGFADIRTYTPGDYPGLIVLRTKRQDKIHILKTMNKFIKILEPDKLDGKLWIVEENKIRVRS